MSNQNILLSKSKKNTPLANENTYMLHVITGKTCYAGAFDDNSSIIISTAP